MPNKNHSIAIVMFLVGLFLRTQIHVIGYIGVSELIICIIAPFIYFHDAIILRRDGMTPILRLAILAIVGCVLSSIENGTEFARFLRGFAQSYSVWASLVFMHRMLRRDFMSYRWFLLGMFISGILSIYILQGTALTRVSADINLCGEAAVEIITNSAMFWVGRILPAFILPVSMFYYQMPLIYSIIAPLIFSFYALTLSHGSGRSAFLASVLGAVLIFLGGKKQHRMYRVSKLFWPLLLIIFIGGIAIKEIYSKAAVNGILGEQAEKKYLDQTKRGDDIWSMIVSGRTDFFVGLYACSKKPIIGYGPWPRDIYGYRVYFMSKYGTEDDLRNVAEYSDKYAMKTIPAHSHLIGYWLEYGVLGLPFWLYVLYLVFRYIKSDMFVIPQVFGWMAIEIPFVVWNIFFSPFSGRVTLPLIIVAHILIHSIKIGKIPMSPEIAMEIWKYNR